jgi:GrpB-like predicted nucleotidyltransferase (UPF0157 family)
MKIIFTSYQADWATQFDALKTELQSLLQALNPTIEHIGSTAIPGLAAKPIIDIAVGLRTPDELDLIPHYFAADRTYIYYKAFNAGMPRRRLFVRLQSPTPAAAFPSVFETEGEIPHEAINPLRSAHVHVWVRDTPDWIRHLAFRDFLRAHDAERQAYETLKWSLAAQEWPNGMAYNQAKDSFVKTLEQEALAWYRRYKTDD